MGTHLVTVGCVAFIGAAFVLVTTAERTARATTITVNATNTVAGDGKCSFDEALNALNGVAGRDACPPGNGINDTISLPAKSTPYNGGINGNISKSVTIVGAGASSTTLQLVSPDDYEVALYLSGPGTATFKNLTIQQDNQNHWLTGLANYGMTAMISGALVKNFRYVGITNVSSLPMTIASSTVSNNGVGFVSVRRWTA